MYQLAFLSGSLKGTRRDIQRRTVTLGSDLSCEIWLSDEQVAPRHAQLEVRAEGIFVRALAPDAPVRMGGLETSEARVSDGDVIEIGPVRVEYHAEHRALARRWARALAMLAAGGGLAAAGVLYLREHPLTGGTEEEPVPAPAVLSPPAPAPSLQEPPALRQMEGLARHMEQAPASPTAAPPVPGLPPETAIVTEAGDVALHNRLEAIRLDIQEGRLSEAEAGLAAMEKEMPACLPVFVERARLFEKRGRVDMAERHWAYVLEKAASGPFYDLAALELSRIAAQQIGEAPPPTPTLTVRAPEAPPEPPRIDILKPGGGAAAIPAPEAPPIIVARVTPPASAAPPPTPAPAVAAPPSPPAAPPRPSPAVTFTTRPPAWASSAAPVSPAPAAPVPAIARTPVPRSSTSATAAVASIARRPAGLASARPAPVLRVLDVEQRRFPVSSDAHEMRTLVVKVAPLPNAPWARPERTTVEVRFFDAEGETGQPFPSRALVPRDPFHLPPGDWSADEPRSVTATYTVPANASSRPSNTRYYGYRVRVFYDGVLQADVCKPTTLKAAN